ncbi:MAG: DUF2608 domain-containing protein [bacterium]
MAFIQSKTKYALLTLTLFCIALILLRSSYLFKESSSGPLKKIDTYIEVQKVFDACDKNTLVTFDVDDTLITAVDVMANLEIPLWFKIRAIARYPEILTNKTKLEFLISMIFQQARRFVFDPDIVRLIHQIQQQESMVIALTSMESGNYGVIKSMPEWRASMLKSLGIEPSKALDDVILTVFPLYRGQHPCLYKGILCANQVAKGEVLGAFLDHYHLKPLQIISFDDDASALNSITNACAQRKIAFTGYQMLGGRKLYGQWDTKRALLQLDFLMQHNRWLSDKEADVILAGQTKHAA